MAADVLTKLYTFQQSEFLCDAFLVSDDGDYVAAHAAVLAAASPWLYTVLLKSETKPSSSGNFVIQTSLNKGDLTDLIDMAYGVTKFEEIKDGEAVDSELKTPVSTGHISNEDLTCKVISLDQYNQQVISQRNEGINTDNCVVFSHGDENVETVNGGYTTDDTTVPHYVIAEEDSDLIQAILEKSLGEGEEVFLICDGDTALPDGAEIEDACMYEQQQPIILSPNLNTDNSTCQSEQIYHKVDSLHAPNNELPTVKTETTIPSVKTETTTDSLLGVEDKVDAVKDKVNMVKFTRPLRITQPTCDTDALKSEKSDTLSHHGHTNAVTTQYRHKCDVCEKKFARKRDLENHIRVHTGDKPFMCEWCGKTCSQLANLQKHERIHTGVKPYSCPVCLKPFSDLSSLTRHKQIIHEKLRPHICKICKKTFTLNSHLRKHASVHAKVKPYPCGLCDRKYCSEFHLRAHRRRAHCRRRWV